MFFQAGVSSFKKQKITTQLCFVKDEYNEVHVYKMIFEVRKTKEINSEHIKWYACYEIRKWWFSSII